MFYMISQDPHDGKEVVKAADNLNEDLKKGIMDGLRRIEQRGERRGEQKGMSKVIKQLLISGMDKPQVARILGFTLKKLEKLLGTA